MAALPTALVICASFGFLASASRLTWAFARDKGLPFSDFLSHVCTTLILNVNEDRSLMMRLDVGQHTLRPSNSRRCPLCIHHRMYLRHQCGIFGCIQRHCLIDYSRSLPVIRDSDCVDCYQEDQARPHCLWPLDTWSVRPHRQYRFDLLFDYHRFLFFLPHGASCRPIKHELVYRRVLWGTYHRVDLVCRLWQKGLPWPNCGVWCYCHG